MRWTLPMLLVVGCSSARYGAAETGAPSLIFPTRLAEGETGRDGGAAPPLTPNEGDAGKREADLPDPEPLVSRRHWDLVFEYDRGTIRLTSVRPAETPKPVATARRMGRFAFELWLGKELVDRVRFDFPMLAVDDPDPGARRPLHDVPRFAPGAQTSAKVRVPESDRATSARLLDRATGRITPIQWPPIEADSLKPAPSP